MKVTFVGYTTIDKWSMADTTGDRWRPLYGDDEGSALSEYAGRACYQSWDRPNAKTATNESYLANIIAQQHFSVLEHASVTVMIQEVSRSLTHELVRHRHFSYSQLSQRFCPVEPGNDEGRIGDKPAFIVPPAFDNNDLAFVELWKAWVYAVERYERLVEIAQADGLTGKVARQAARAVLPNMTPTEIVVTGNHRAWREFITKRATRAADPEIRRLAAAIYDQLVNMEPFMYEDITLTEVEGYGRIVA